MLGGFNLSVVGFSIVKLVVAVNYLVIYEMLETQALQHSGL